jgi:hypothetical protein
MSLRTLTQWTVFLQSCSDDPKVFRHVADDVCEISDIVKLQTWKECTYLQNVLMTILYFVIGCDVLLQLQFYYRADNRHKHDSVSRQMTCPWALFRILCF